MKLPTIPSAGHRDAENLPTAAAQTFVEGAALVLDASRDISECGADPAAIYGFAAHDAGKDPQDADRTTVFKAIEGEKFWMPCSSAPDEATHRNNAYGIAKDGDGRWYVDFTDTVNTRVYVHRVDEDRDLVEVSVLEAYRQIAP